MEKNDHNIVNKNRKIKYISIASLLFILFFYLTISVNSIMNGNKIGFFSLKFYIMSSDSSEANTSSGDLVVAREIKIEDIKENDNIIYKRNNRMHVKKVIKTDSENGKAHLYIENDNVISNEMIENVEIIGKVVFSIKGFGNFALFIQSPMGTLNILAIAICMFIIIRKISKGVQSGKVNDPSEKDLNKVIGVDKEDIKNI